MEKRKRRLFKMPLASSKTQSRANGVSFISIYAVPILVSLAKLSTTAEARQKRQRNEWKIQRENEKGWIENTERKCKE